MLPSKGIANNFRFMVVQVTKQLEHALHLLDEPTAQISKSFLNADDYIDNQKSRIETECFSFVRFNREADDRDVDFIRAINVITGNLERIADFAVNIVNQVRFLGDRKVLEDTDHRAYFSLLLKGMDLICNALFERDSSLALEICRAEDELDKLYHDDFQRILSALRSSEDVGELVTLLFILHYLERMGDALLNIGEAILFAVLGERLKIRQYRALDAAISSTTTIERPLSEVEIASIWGTRSGLRVGVVQDHEDSGATTKVLFKGGNPEKLQQEKENLERWGQIAPGLVPEVVEYRRKGRDAALLLEYIDGNTVQDVVLNAEGDILQKILARIEETVRMMWTETRQEQRVNGHYLQQLRDRIDDVARLHSFIEDENISIGELNVPSREQLLDAANEIDAETDAPFSVFIHGDFNLDNIIYNRQNDTLHLVDVYRSRDMDYVQDVSVFLVSCYRLPVFEQDIRRNLEALSSEFLGFVRSFAREQGDATFEARLTLGLVRSFITSMRFELNRGFARSMYDRAILLLTTLIDHKGKSLESFDIPDGVLAY
ncbi:MAG: phosphotransferase [Phycisphaerales bacterium]|nr:phosphotransferase [Phycisphaerales bacterium]